MRAILFSAVTVQRERMFGQLEAALGSDVVLALFNLLVEKLLDQTTIQAN